MLRQPESVSRPSTQYDQAIVKLENRLLDKPDDNDAARQLLNILNFYTPTEDGIGPYSDCQRMLASGDYEEVFLSATLNTSKVAEQHKGRQALLSSMGVEPRVAIAQLFAGKIFTIQGMETNCNLRMELFNRKGVISKLCHDCFKVQILPLNVVALMQVYFAIREIDLPRDNYRKCMVELREDVAYPYKGYIFCESEEEATACLEILRQTLKSLQIADVYCGISHGCSEYGLKYPEFKFSQDGSHRSFERPTSWDQSEADFFFSIPEPPSFGKNLNHKGLTLRDVIGLRTWVDYAEIIGDDSCKRFFDSPSANRPEPFATRVTRQAQQRKAQLMELGNRLSCAT